MLYIILDIRLAPTQQEHSAGLVVAVLAAEMESRKAAAIFDVRICLGFAQKLNSLAVAFPGCFVKSRISVLQKIKHFKKSPSNRQLKIVLNLF